MNKKRVLQVVLRVLAYTVFAYFAVQVWALVFVAAANHVWSSPFQVWPLIHFLVVGLACCASIYLSPRWLWQLTQLP